MITSVSVAALALLIGVGAVALAQTQPSHQQHQSGTAPAAPATSSPAPQSGMQMGQMMQNMPEQCRAAMQAMPQSCMGAMHQMMQGGMAMGAIPAATPQSDSTKAYLAAMDKMHAPMMDGVKAANPDVAFVRGMIPHHQGAIDMARIVLQYGKDDYTKKLANDVIREQLREIADMEAWLKKNAP